MNILIVPVHPEPASLMNALRADAAAPGGIDFAAHLRPAPEGADRS